MECLGHRLWPWRKRPKEPDDAIQLAIGGQLTEVNSLRKHLPIREHHAPGEAKLLVMRIDPANELKAGARELLKEPADVIDECLPAGDVCSGSV
jgi:hypothetical protein